MALTLEESNVSNNQEFTEMLNDLQANILKHHGRDFAYHLFLTIKSEKSVEAKNWIADFAASKITSTAKQLVDSKIKKEHEIDGGTVYTLSLSSSGYDKLEIESLKPENQAFQEGMKQRSTELADNPENWENEFKNQIDVLIIIANSSKELAIKEKEDLLVQLTSIFDVVKIQKGEVLKRGKIGIEHFGYADGISQPMFLKQEVLSQKSISKWNDKAKLKLALVKDKGGKFEDSFGSYLVFRKLEQNVEEFKKAEEKLLEIKHLDHNGTLAVNKELPGAMIVGRFEDGTEVFNSSFEKGITDPNDFNNDFDYSNNLNESKCPFHSHIRITNPRADTGDTGIDSFVQSVRLVRRGIPYNEIGRVETEGLPPSGVGLLFMCYQRSIEDQFEFIQSIWANKGDVRLPDRKPRLVGQDGIIGQGPNSFQKKLPEQWDVNGITNNCEFSNPNSDFVTMKGGEYFFTPSISFLKSLLFDI